MGVWWQPIWARAGGGGGFGGGGSGGTGGGGGGGFSFVSPGVVLVGAIVVVVVVACTYPVYRVRRRQGGAAVEDNAVLEEGAVLGRLPGDVPATADQIQLTAERTQALAALARAVPSFGPEAFATAVERAYFAVHGAVHQLDPGRVQHLVSAELAADLRQIVARLAQHLSGRPVPVADVAVGKCLIDAAWCGPTAAVVGATLTVAITPPDGVGAIHGWERLVFVHRVEDEPGPSGAGPSTDNAHCRACGAPLDTDLAGACRHCGANLTALAGWTLAEMIPAGHDADGFAEWLEQGVHHSRHRGAAIGLVEILGAVVDVVTGF